jgi:hypothetical protein
MFFKLSNDQIISAKMNSFPQRVDDYDAIVTSKGSDNNIKIIINIIDGINKQYKVFNNLAAQKYMKLKIFEINSDNMKNEIEIAAKSENPSAIEEIIRKYGVVYKTLSAAYDFKGDVYKLKNRNNYSGITRLKYETDILLPRETINYFSLGIYFYYDLPAYLKEINVEERFIDKAITWDKLHVFSLYANNKEYFTNLYKEINSGEYDKAFYDYFLNIDLSEFDFINERPITNFYKNMKEMNIPILSKYFESVVDVYSENCSVSASDLFTNFNEFLKTNNFKVEYTSTKFGIDIKNYEGIT